MASGMTKEHGHVSQRRNMRPALQQHYVVQQRSVASSARPAPPSRLQRKEEGTLVAQSK